MSGLGVTRVGRLLSIVIPVFNEDDALPILFDRLIKVMNILPIRTEVLLVNDGSRDKSLALMLEWCRADPRFKVVDLSRNFGHQIAISAGIDKCSGDVALIMDADLQDPPELIPEMLKRWEQGFDIVYGIREDRPGEGRLKSLTARVFYRLLKRLANIDIPVDAGDFRLVGQNALQAFRAMRERDRYVRGMFAWIGFRQVGIRFIRPARAAGKTKYPFGRMFNLAVSGIISFSDAPLRFIVGLGFLVSGLSLLGGLFTIALWALGAQLVRGWTSLVLLVALFMGLNFLVVGIVGLYVGRIHEEVKGRQLYIVKGLYRNEDSSIKVLPAESADTSQQPFVRQSTGGA